MLLELTITNLAIIQEVRLAFEGGLTVLTGETGAGKSIIVDAVMLLLGGRANADMVRTGCECAAVEGIFAPGPAALAQLQPLLEEYGLAEGGEELILRREIQRSRRNICRINGRAVPLSVLEALGRHLIDIHGQGEHLSLMQVRRHVDFLDQYGGLAEQRQALAQVVAELRDVRAQRQALQRDKREMARRVDLLAYQIDEIRSAALVEGEDEELLRQRNLLANAEQRLQLAAGLYEALTGSDGRHRAAIDLIGQATEQMSDLLALDPTLQEEGALLESAYYQLEEIARSVRTYRDEIEFDPEGLAAIEERLELIRSLKRKYGDSIGEILAFGQRAQEELEGISHSEERLEALQSQEAALLRQIAAQGQALSQARRAAARGLGEAVEQQLNELNMAHARFFVDIRWEPAEEGVEIEGQHYRFDATGLDRVEFLIAPNPGEEPQPLARIASGGETSRLMLAMKVVLSRIDPVPTLIFDEIDAGIGGRTGDIVGKKLWQLSQGHQVFCVTHLAQIARYAERHYQITKEVVDERTLSVAQLLSGEARVEELAIMLGGTATDTTRQSARELLATAVASEIAS